MSHARGLSLVPRPCVRGYIGLGPGPGDRFLGLTSTVLTLAYVAKLQLLYRGTLSCSIPRLVWPNVDYIVQLLYREVLINLLTVFLCYRKEERWLLPSDPAGSSNCEL